MLVVVPVVLPVCPFRLWLFTTRRGGRVGSCPRFSIGDMEAIMDVIEQILPLGPGKWEQVADTHVTLYQEAKRDVSSLRCNFQSLYNLQVPTGNPQCPPHVRHAKRACVRIEERANLTYLAEGSEADLGFDNINDEIEDGGTSGEG